MREVDRLGVIREVAGKRLRQREGGERPVWAEGEQCDSAGGAGRDSCFLVFFLGLLRDGLDLVLAEVEPIFFVDLSNLVLHGRSSDL